MRRGRASADALNGQAAQLLSRRVTGGISALAWFCVDQSPSFVLDACDWVRAAIDPLRERRLAMTALKAADHSASNSLLVMGGLSAERLANRFLDQASRRQPLGDIPVSSLPERLPALADQYELVVSRVASSVSRRIAGDNAVRIPSLVRLGIDTPLTPETAAYVRTAQRGNLRRIKDAGFTFETSVEPRDFHAFYHDYYLPYQQQRFGELSDRANFRRLRYVFRHGGRIFWIVRDGQRLSGSLVVARKNILHTTVIGVRDGNFDHVRSGTFAANYYFLTRWAAEMGCGGIDLGLTPPCLTDGLTLTKRRWGASVSPPNRDRFDYVLCWNRCTARIRQFLNDVPLVFRDGHRFSGLTAVPVGEPGNQDVIGKIVDRCWAPGLQRLIVIADDAESSVDESRGYASDSTVWLARPDAPGVCIANAMPSTIVPARLAGHAT
jgi:hypothetical protein